MKILNIEIEVIDKDEKFTHPGNAVVINIVRKLEYMPEWVKPYANVNYTNQKLIIMYTDPKRYTEKAAKIYDFIEMNLQITKEEIKSKSRKAEICFARHLFHWALRKSILSFSHIGRETGRHHASVMHSLKDIDNVINFGNGWRKKTINKLIKEMESW